MVSLGISGRGVVAAFYDVMFFHLSEQCGEVGHRSAVRPFLGSTGGWTLCGFAFSTTGAFVFVCSFCLFLGFIRRRCRGRKGGALSSARQVSGVSAVE